MHTCPVCDNESSSPVCPNCGFDSSCDYERYPTLQQPETLPNAVSFLRAHLGASGATPSVEAALTALRSQGWNPHVVSAVKKILDAAMDGNLTEQHSVEIFLNVNDSKPSLPYEDNMLYSPPVFTHKLSSFCKVCGTSNGRGTIYCSGCGSRIDGTAPDASVPKSNTRQPQNRNPLPLSKFCDHCGCNIPSGSIYCPGCSAKVE